MGTVGPCGQAGTVAGTGCMWQVGAGNASVWCVMSNVCVVNGVCRKMLCVVVCA